MSIVKKPESGLFKFLFRDALKREDAMQGHFQMTMKQKNGNIYITPKGTFNGNSAWELVHLLHSKFQGKGKIFIDTRFISEMCPFGCDTFQKQLNLRNVPPSSICFKGRNGFLMAPMGSKVIVTSENGAHQCKGNCENCKCRSPKKALAAPVFDGPESKERVAV